MPTANRILVSALAGALTAGVPTLAAAWTTYGPPGYAPPGYAPPPHAYRGAQPPWARGYPGSETPFAPGMEPPMRAPLTPDETAAKTPVAPPTAGTQAAQPQPEGAAPPPAPAPAEEGAQPGPSWFGAPPGASMGYPGRIQITRDATPDAYLIRIGIGDGRPEDVQITPAGRGLIIGINTSAQTEQEDRFNDGRGYRRSFSYSRGSMSRRLPLPRDADLGAMTREVAAGAILLRIPRTARWDYGPYQEGPAGAGAGQGATTQGTPGGTPQPGWTPAPSPPLGYTPDAPSGAAPGAPATRP